MLKTAVLMILLLFSLTAQAETGKRDDARDVAAGKTLYLQYCISCHKNDGVGEKPIPPLLKQPGYLTAMPLNETSHAWHHGDEQLVSVILNGLQRTQRMPAMKGVLSEQQASQLVAYIKSLWSDRILACQGPRHMSCM